MSVAGPVRLATILGGLALAIALALTARSMRPRQPLPVLGHVPTFRLVDERGAPFTTESMLGHVSVVDFVFTRCTSSCPRLTARMAELQQRLGRSEPDIRLVSFSVDPENDTPAVLADYAAKVGAQAGRWTFVTGTVDDIERAVVLGFKVSAARIAKGAADYDVVHGEWLVLVDRAGDLRGYYPVGEERELQALVDDVARIGREKK
ncbi:MAG TPA: SCO family protein [Polyangiaceae bacterium]|nr:SCO family protein [Polyangiaceae bacterium]